MHVAIGALMPSLSPSRVKVDAHDPFGVVRLSSVVLALALSACSADVGGDSDLAVDAASRALTTADADVPADPACDPSTITWSSPDSTTEACRGPWEYERYPECRIRHESCGDKYCPAWKTCAHWSFGAQIQEWSHRDFFPRNAPLSCSRGHCSIDISAAHAICLNEAQTYIAPMLADPDTPTHLKSYIKVVSASYTVVGTTQMRCSWTVQYPVPGVGTGEVCEDVNGARCSVDEVYPECDYRGPECGPSTRVASAPGLSYDALVAGDPTGAYGETGDRAPRCSSAEHVPMDTPGDVRAKYELLRESWDRLPDSRPTFARNLRQLYELRGHELLPEQREFVRELYRDFPLPLACGVPADSPIDPECSIKYSEIDFAEIDATLTRCARLASGHVPTALHALELSSCTDALEGELIRTLRCSGPEVRAALRQSVTTMVARSLSLIDRPQAEQTDGLGTLERQLHLMNRWDDALSASYLADDPELVSEHRAIRSEVLGRFWRHAQTQRAVLSDLAIANIDVQEALEEATERGLTLDRDVLVAAHTPITALPAVTSGGQVVEPEIVIDGPPLRGSLLLIVTGDALTGLNVRLDDLGAFHDFACQFAGCDGTAPTQLARYYAALAALDQADPLAAALAALPAGETLDGWRNAFDAIHAGHATFAQALTEANLELPITTADPLEVEPEALAIGRIVLSAKQRIAAFSSTGMLEPTERRTLFAGVDDRQRNLVIQTVQQAMDRLEDDAQEYEGDLSTIVSGVLSEVGTAQALDRIRGERLRIARAIDLAVNDIAGLQASASAEDVRFGTLAAAVTGLDGALDSGQFVPVGNTLHFSLDGTAALYEGGTPHVDTISAEMVQADAGEMVGIATTGAWSPVCALRGAEVQIAEGVTGSFNPNGTVIGPEGFTVVVSNNETHAASASFQDTTTDTRTIGVSAKACVGGWFAYVVQTEACVHGDVSRSWSEQSTDSWSDDLSTSTSSQFVSGLRLKGTPVPTLPAGALLVVEMPRGVTSPLQIRDIHVVRAPYTSILVSQDADLYLVANDKNCGVHRDDQHELNVQVRRFQSEIGIATAVVEEMQETLASVRALEPILVAQGSILPSQLGALRSEAVHSLNAATGVPYSSLPSPLSGMFEAFLDREMVRLERAVQIAALERNIDSMALELELLRQEELLVAQQGRLAQLVPGWTLRNLDGERLRDSAQDLVTLSRRHLYPVLDLWYPEALDDLDVSTAAAPLLAAGPQTRTIDLVSHVRSVLDATLSSLSLALPGYKDSPHRPLVAASFMHPDVVPGPFTPVSTLPKADVQRASVLWADVEDAQTSRITLRPEDVYSLYGGAGGQLACTEAVPVIQRMALFVVRPGFATDIQDLNDEQRWLTGRASVTQPFAEEEGPVLYTLGNARWQPFQIPILYGTYTGALSTFVDRVLGSSSTVLPEGPAGLSPFGEIEINFEGLEDLRGGMLGDGITTPGSEATELVLVMQVDSRSTAQPLSWVPQCAP